MIDPNKLAIVLAVGTTVATCSFLVVYDRVRQRGRRKAVAATLADHLAYNADLIRMLLDDTLEPVSFNLNLAALGATSSEWPSLFDDDVRSKLNALHTQGQQLEGLHAMWRATVVGRAGLGNDTTNRQLATLKAIAAKARPEFIAGRDTMRKLSKRKPPT